MAVVASEVSAPTPRVVSRWNPANAVTASRYLTLPPFAWAVIHGYHQWATLFILICGVLDKADGLVAVAACGWAPVIPVALVIGLGVANIIMRVAYGLRAQRATNYKSYAMERLVAYTGYLIGFATAGFEVTFYFWMFPPVMITILCYDAKRMLVD